MSQSQIVPVKLTDNEKSPQKLWAHIKTSSGTEVRLFKGGSPQLTQMILEKM